MTSQKSSCNQVARKLILMTKKFASSIGKISGQRRKKSRHGRRVYSPYPSRSIASSPVSVSPRISGDYRAGFEISCTSTNQLVHISITLSGMAPAEFDKHG